VGGFPPSRGGAVVENADLRCWNAGKPTRGYEFAYETGDVFRKSFELRMAWFSNESSDIV
jgi:hypothetical protein